MRADFNAPANPSMKKQLAFILARAQVPKEWLEAPSEDGMDDDASELPEELLEHHVAHTYATTGNTFVLNEDTLSTCSVCQNSEIISYRYESLESLQTQELVA